MEQDLEKSLRTFEIADQQESGEQRKGKRDQRRDSPEQDRSARISQEHEPRGHQHRPGRQQLCPKTQGYQRSPRLFVSDIINGAGSLGIHGHTRIRCYFFGGPFGPQVGWRPGRGARRERGDIPIDIEDFRLSPLLRLPH